MGRIRGCAALAGLLAVAGGCGPGGRQASPAPPPASTGIPDLGINASLNGMRIFPADDPWNTPIDSAEVDPLSARILGRIGLDRRLHPDFYARLEGVPYGMRYIVVPDSTPRVPVTFEHADESDPGPYPIPPDPPINGDASLGHDAHLLIITRDERKLYELFHVSRDGSGWKAGSGAIFDLTHGTRRPEGWTSADAAGLPIVPGLVRYDEVGIAGEIRHALRFTVARTRRASVPPATHWASLAQDEDLPPMGMRVRLKASVAIDGYPPQAQVILRALKRYGLILADNGGDFFVTGAADPRWDDGAINALKRIRVGDFEVVRMTGMRVP